MKWAFTRWGPLLGRLLPCVCRELGGGWGSTFTATCNRRIKVSDRLWASEQPGGGYPFTAWKVYTAFVLQCVYVPLYWIFGQRPKWEHMHVMYINVMLCYFCIHIQHIHRLCPMARTSPTGSTSSRAKKLTTVREIFLKAYQTSVPKPQDPSSSRTLSSFLLRIASTL